jgi:DNA-binding NarL/FixJ family response regulator
VEWHGRVVYNPQKEIDFIFFVGIDITERIRLEQVIMENDEQERSRIGQDLHDGLGQHLAGIAFKSEILRLKFEEKLPDAQDDIREIVKLVNQAINQTRDLARGLCPVDRHGGGLEAALNDLASEVHEGHDINCIVTIDSSIEIESDITSTHLYYISREAVNNAIKHSGAKNIMINLERADDALVLSIIDDGIGISRDSEEGMGTGVGIMQYRTWLLGGSFSIGKNEGGGTVVIVTVKMEEHDIVREKETVLKEQINTSREEGVTRILIVDDHPIVRQGLIQILNMEEDLEVCGEARTADEAIRMTSNLEPHMLIIDLSLEGASGLDLLKAIRSRYPSLPVLVLSMYDEAIYGERTIQAGARGYVMKQEAPQTIVDAVRTVLQGRHYYSDTVRERILDSFHAYTGERSLSVSSLTNREFEVFQLLGHGMSNRTIAEKLNISIKTIENYRERIKNKLNIPSSTELVQYAVQLVIDQSKKQ